uniref:Apple domain-containing protein n=1 Tax=Lactuca sativa TaxID=4236 RepID=A0A9R1UQS2_LACSA|nr:hypothetical protein LSAT_V11C800446070 [Lactuca sativa]
MGTKDTKWAVYGNIVVDTVGNCTYKHLSSLIRNVHVIALIQCFLGLTPTDTCNLYGRCGPYGISTLENPICSCIQGFEPRVLKGWIHGDMSDGCKRKKPLNCGTKDVFHKISGVKFPDTRHSLYNLSMSREECEQACRRNCSFTAYADLDIRNGGSGCLLWFDDLMDIRKKRYIRFLQEEGSCHYSAFGFFSSNACVCRNKGQTFDKDKVEMENFGELPFFSLYRIAKATNNFSIDNQIGEGDFGPVYKGVLEDGKVVAIKRLSETSQQGHNEFQNEFICIAKLQHQNLVKLLGYSIHGNEKILIYEYKDKKDWTHFYLMKLEVQWLIGLNALTLSMVWHEVFFIYIKIPASKSSIEISRQWIHFSGVCSTWVFLNKLDVFSFGVILLEIVSGKKNREFSHGTHSDNLLALAWRLYKEGKSIELMSVSLCTYVSPLKYNDQYMLDYCACNIMQKIGRLCYHDGVLPPPKQPAFFTEESNGLLNSVSSLDNEYMITLLYPRYMVGCTKGRRVDCVLRVCFGNYVLFGVTFVNIHNCWWFSYFPMVTFVFIYYFEACYCTPHYCTLHYHHLFPSQHRFMINLFSQVIQITQKTWQMEIFT